MINEELHCILGFNRRPKTALFYEYGKLQLAGIPIPVN